MAFQAYSSCIIFPSWVQIEVLRSCPDPLMLYYKYKLLKSKQFNDYMFINQLSFNLRMYNEPTLIRLSIFNLAFNTFNVCPLHLLRAVQKYLFYLQPIFIGNHSNQNKAFLNFEIRSKHPIFIQQMYHLKNQQFKGPCHNLNTAIYLKFQELYEQAEKQKQFNKSLSFATVIKSLEKYPIPILTLDQAEKIEGIGTKMLAIIMPIIKEQYKDYLRDQTTPEGQVTLNDFFNTKVNNADKQVKSKSKCKSQDQSQSQQMSVFDCFFPYKQKQKQFLVLQSLMRLKTNDQEYFTKEELEMQIQSLENLEKKPSIPIKIIEELIEKNLIQSLCFGYATKYAIQEQCEKQLISYLAFQAQKEAAKHKVKSQQQEDKRTFTKEEILDYKITLIVDQREKRSNYENINYSYFVEAFQSNEVVCQSDQLSLGDFIW